MSRIARTKYSITVHDSCAKCGKRLDLSVSSSKEVRASVDDVLLILGFARYDNSARLICRDCVRAFRGDSKAVEL